jgi:hypothetical protein
MPPIPNRANERQQNLEPESDDGELRKLFLGIEHEDRAFIIRLKAVSRGQ